ncbi:aspartyl/glutamyl-tRNA(Asn/Gln) amidotransferase, C subunit [Pseudoramibacter alactolyticus ATCC 23263]|jgi:aspartyl-tRNA(Asn)/glutamyl-tRNA(Gln) amidotransferase subunit C|uniref:Aspartyl/glutamyl-tRNA(Asn/Gln) amidotransferase subunit C n=1 Tax=Pseudoramibacter alactolyticus ATCC 23263 TaxID=887929 RepID=E6MEU1_9FIRM|nr:Asp-tRNA(Asn)/Glu-tRNA(Gln) amidotransferase subunit GatC [Pseudoramibacter alactolyticus]EFV02379.1 aspartyl/glutamyl-tRNA(Asn/Gln) amidotransferase, C subunit [Pseudoramibacter alactolyticus ATCC 23263]MBM6968384.1 Asp-tRNA(Asn)/Glu-tRNA(Gln) amidotransferase subunit GatC [Pseudoramibacter alactolyticus]
MSISKEDVTYVANLARLRFDGAATEKMVKELDSVLDYVNTLNEVDTTDVAATEHILPVKNVYRKDEIGESLPNEVALANAPDSENGCFKVPRVLE